MDGWRDGGGGFDVFDPPSRNNQQSPGAGQLDLNMCVRLFGVCVCVCVFSGYMPRPTPTRKEIKVSLPSSLSLSLSTSLAHISHTPSSPLPLLSLILALLKTLVIAFLDFFDILSLFFHLRGREMRTVSYAEQTRKRATQPKEEEGSEIKWKNAGLR